MVFNANFNNNSAISWGYVLLMEETEYPEITTILSQVSDILYHIMLYRLRGVRTHNVSALVVIGTYCICSNKSNYHAITTTTAHLVSVNVQIKLSDFLIYQELGSQTYIR